MSVLGKVDSLWRYPVKSMAGEELEEAFLGFAGLFRPRFRHPEKAARPPNLTEAENIAPGITPLYADLADLAIDVETPSGEVLAVDDPALLALLARRTDSGHNLTLLCSRRAMTDCRPVSLFAIQTARQLGDETGITVDKRRFRANIYMDLDSAGGFGEDAYVGRTLRIGTKVLVSVLEPDPRCKMITLDPDTAEPSPQLLRTVTQAHDGNAGVYGAVLVEGTIRRGDTIEAV
jgi:uncharacterized protein